MTYSREIEMYCKPTFLKNLGRAKTFKKWQNLPKQASTVIPLISVKNQPSILFMTRPENISYGGQICFPGGKFDPKFDQNLQDTALRETFEEIGISPENIDIWAQIPGMPDRFGKMLINPFVAELYPKGNAPSPKEFLKHINRDEVDQVFTIPTSHLLDPKFIKIVEYQRSNYKTDNPEENRRVYKMPVYKVQDLVPEIEVDIWGLTAMQLNFALHYLYGQKLMVKSVPSHRE